MRKFRSWKLEDGRWIRAKALSKKCVQPVSPYMNNEWVQLPQVMQVLWTNYIYLAVVSPATHLFLYLTHQLPTELCAPKKRDITDSTPYFSTLSTLPITTTTIYI